MVGMMIADWLQALGARGVEFWPEGDRLRFRGPKGTLSAEERTELSSRRAEVVTYLREVASEQVETLPLSFSQQSLWFLHQQSPTSTAYHVCFATRVEGVIDVPALRSALQGLVDRHASLRTTYVLADGVPSQRVVGATPVAFEVHDVPGIGDEALRAAVEADHRQPFDLEHGPVFRAALFRRGPADQVLALNVHHIAADGWSLMILADELLRLYAEATGGEPAGLSRPTLEYADYACWQQEMLGGPEGERLWSYWRGKLTPLPVPLDLPGDRPRPATKSFRGASHPITLPADLTERIRELARREATTAFVVLLACFQSLLHLLSGTNDIVVGTPTFARGKAEFMRVVGDFVNSVPLRAKVEATMSFRALIQQLRLTVMEALDAQELPLPLLVQRLQIPRDPSRSPIFETFFGLLRFDQFKELQHLMAGSGPGDAVELSGLRLVPFPLDQQEGQFDLALQMAEGARLVQGVLKYSTEIFDAATAATIAEDFVALADASLREPDRALGDLPAPRAAAPARKVAVAQSTEGAVGPVRISRDGRLPVSAVQHRFWFMDRMEPGQSFNNIGAACWYRGRLDVELMKQAVQALVDRQESLRTQIVERDGAPELLIRERDGVTLDWADLGRLPEESREREAIRLWTERLKQPFDLACGPVCRFLLVRMSPEEHFLAMAMHHAVSDGWSLVIAAREIGDAYEALSTGRQVLPPPEVQYVDYAAWERDRVGGGRLRADVAYWRQELEGAPGLLELPTDRPRPASLSHRGRRVRRAFPPDLLKAIKRLSREHQTTLFTTLVAGLQVLLHRYSGQDDLVIGSPVANRDLPELERVIGCFVNNLVLRGRLGGNPTFSDFLAQVRTTIVAALDHRYLPFEVLVDAVRSERSTNHAPVFQVLFVLHSFGTNLPDVTGLKVEPVLTLVDPGISRFDIVLEMMEQHDELMAIWEYSTDLFDDETIERMHAQLERLLMAVTTEPSLRVEEIPLLGSDEERRILDDWNSTGLEHDRGRCVHHLLEAQARFRPEAIAVIDAGGKLTFRDLESRANQLAHVLVERGVKPGSLAAVCVDRTADMLVAIAAVLKTGAAYVPLDPAHPAERLRYTLEDAGAACAVTLVRFAPLLADAGAPLVLIDRLEADLAERPLTPPTVEVKAEDRAYVIYTSGSTGRPKGVEVEHRNVVAFLEAMRRKPGITADDALLAVTTLSFDIAGLEMWLPIMVGARIVIATRSEALDGERLAALLEEQQITVLQATPATWRLLLGAGWTGKRDLKALCGGEALPKDLAQALVGRVSELWNMYGPTETTIWSTLSRIDDPNGPITVGRPIENTRTYVLERSGHPAPVGVPGELCIGGEGVARGYHDRPELTAEKFVTVTLPGGRRDRVYRTGDMARLMPDGRIDFLGRRDQQVKVRGHRIELGEIEAALARHRGVSRCVAAVREDTAGDAQLVGYVVEESVDRFVADDARTALRSKLPEYMVPNVFVVLDELPLTPNGKIDRKRLPAPEGERKAASVPADDAHMTPVQRSVAALWRSVLHTASVGLHDNFFDLGGHSLLLVKLHAALRAEFGDELKLVDLFQWTTVAAQAARLQATRPTATEAPVVAPADNALRRAQARAARQLRG
jgi:amino acid adenylation domain-containing protein